MLLDPSMYMVCYWKIKQIYQTASKTQKSYKTVMNIFHFPWNPLLYEVQYYHYHITESLSY